VERRLFAFRVRRNTTLICRSLCWMRRAESGFAYVFEATSTPTSQWEELRLPNDDLDGGETAVDSSVAVDEPPAHYQNDVPPPVAAPVEAAVDSLDAGHSTKKSKSSTCALM
jgi:hypothetical protein